MAIERKVGPSCLVFSRQTLAHQPRTDAQLHDIARGGYVLKDPEGTPQLILIATGSEVALAMQVAAALPQLAIRVVSMPSTNVFEAQDAAYRDAVLPRTVRRRVAIEAAAKQTWWRYVGLDGEVVGMNGFGASGTAKDLFKHFGFTVEDIVKVVQRVAAQ